MAEHLEELGWRVGPERLAVADSVEPGGIFSQSTKVVGALRARRYGWEAPVMVRVDDCGEVYPRLADPDDISNATLRMVEGPDVFEFHDLDVNGWASPEGRVSSVIAALAIERMNEIGMSDGLDLE